LIHTLRLTTMPSLEVLMRVLEAGENEVHLRVYLCVCVCVCVSVCFCVSKCNVRVPTSMNMMLQSNEYGVTE
jgi:hypothetical protein